MFGILRGKGREVSVTENQSEIEGVERTISDLEARIASDEAELVVLEGQQVTARYGHSRLGEVPPPAGLEDAIAGMKERLAVSFQEIRQQRGYLGELELPLLESQRREALAEYDAHITGLEAVIRAEAEGQVAYMETRGRSLEFERETRRLVKAADRLSRQLGEPDVVMALAPLGSRFRPESVMTGAADRPSDYQAAADRLRAVLDASEADVRKAQEASNNDRTRAQSDLVFLWGPGGEREQAKKAKTAGRERITARKAAGLPV